MDAFLRRSGAFGLALALTIVMPLPAQLPSVPQPTMRYAGPTTAADSLDMAIALFRAAIAHGTYTAHPAALPRLVCVSRGSWLNGDPPVAVLAALQQIADTLIVRPISACGPRPAPDRTPNWADTLTGQRGITVWIAEPRFVRGDGSFEVDMGYNEHGLSAMVWRCTGRRRHDGWTITTCRMTMAA